MKRSTIRFLIMVVAMGLAISTQSCKPKESFMLAFFEDGGSRVRVRWSDTGTSWKDGEFPAGAVPNGVGVSGVGSASDDAGFLRFVGLSGPNKIHLVWGLGSNAWDQTAQGQFTYPPESAPSMVNIDSQKEIWLVAYKRSGDTVAITLFNTKQRSFGLDIAPPPPLNANVVGRPAVTRMGTTALVVWRRDNGDLVAVAGQTTSGGISLGTPTLVPTAATMQLQQGVVNDPAVTHNHSRFLLTAPREERGGGAGTLHGWQAPVLASSDGVTWTPFLTSIGHGVRDDSLLGLAGRSDGSLIAIELQRAPRNSSRATATVTRCAGGSWSTLDTTVVLGVQPAYRQFSLIAVGRPASPRP